MGTVSSSMVIFYVILCAWSPAVKVLVGGTMLDMRKSFRSPYLLSLCIMSSATYILMEHGLLVAFLVAVTKYLIK